MKTPQILSILSLLGILGIYGCEADVIDVGGVCGDGIQGLVEACDDGNTEDGDGCSSDCMTVEDGYVCEKANTSCEKLDENCGNGVLDSGESCDDGNHQSGDGCSANCKKVESGYRCPPTGGACTIDETVVSELCGNGELDEDEVCDDGNNDNGDGCSRGCNEIESGYVCPIPGKLCTGEPAICGDGIRNAGEECDYDYIFGEPADGDGCTTDCKVEEGYSCDDFGCALHSCGNGILEGNEACEYDDFMNPPVDYGLGADGQVGCNIYCQRASYCGDGKIQSDHGEACDLGPSNGSQKYGKEGCTLDCQLAPYCGDGLFEEGMETCDPKDENAAGGCTDDCKAKNGYVCSAINGKCIKLSDTPGGEDPTKPYVPACNNGIIDSDEECDDPTHAGCANCKAASGYKCINSPKRCTTDCTSQKSECARIEYGNGKIDSDGYEQCDDGNTSDGDGCSSTGLLEPGYVCPTPGKACVAAACGDGIRALGEECDDGNASDGDGCSKRCRIEQSATCSSNPLGGKSTCTSGSCGDGKVGKGEQCDGGSNCKNCKNTSKSGTCGNGNKEPGEDCDDGNLKGGDGCSPTCQIESAFECYDNGKEEICRPVCGDGITMWMLGADVKEECDDGNVNSGDGCSSDCKIEYGFTCTDFEHNPYPDSISLPVTYRDFRGRDTSGSGSSSGYQSSSWISKLSSQDNACGSRKIEKDSEGMPSWLFSQSGYSAGEKYLKEGKGHPDFQGFGRNLCLGMVENALGADGKPVFTSKGLDASCCGPLSASECEAKAAAWPNGSGTYKVRINKDKVRSHVLCGPSFNTWFRTDSDINQEIPYTLLLTKDPSGTGKYVFDSDNPPSGAKGAGGQPFTTGYFSPLDGAGYNDTRSISLNGNYYSLAGDFTTEVHTYFQYKPDSSGDKSTLNFTGDDDVWVFINNKLFVDLGGMHSKLVGENSLVAQNCSNGQLCDPNFEVYSGGVYDMHVFQAEREYTGSNFKLTLTGFINSGKSTCQSICGDNVVSALEECDEGTNAEAANFKGCTTNCKKQSYCGNGIVEAGEQCDNGWGCQTNAALCSELGTTYNSTASCDKSCKYTNSVCGNNIKEGDEQCDGTDTPAGETCLKTCRLVGCGDGIVSGNEECDNGKNNGLGACTKACTKSRCGDGIVDEFNGEVCDDGKNDGSYGGCGLNCTYRAPYCGDGVVQSAYEQCDNGTANNTGAYNGCNPDCTRAAYCGDGIVNGNEQCDGTASCSDKCFIIIN